MNRPANCHCEDFPCCGCGEEPSQESQHEEFEAMHDFDADCCDGESFDDDDDDDGDGMTDVEADADALASAGMGTDEDYGHYGDDTPMGDDFGGE